MGVHGYNKGHKKVQMSKSRNQCSGNRSFGSWKDIFSIELFISRRTSIMPGNGPLTPLLRNHVKGLQICNRFESILHSFFVDHRWTRRPIYPFFLGARLLKKWVQIGFPYCKIVTSNLLWFSDLMNDGFKQHRSATRPWRIWPDSLDNRRCTLWALPSGMTEAAWGSQSGWTAWHQQSWAPASNKNEFIVDSDFKCWTEGPFSGRLNFASSVAGRG